MRRKRSTENLTFEHCYHPLFEEVLFLLARLVHPVSTQLACEASTSHEITLDEVDLRSETSILIKPQQENLRGYEHDADHMEEEAAVHYYETAKISLS